MYLGIWLESLLVFLVIKDEKNTGCVKSKETHGLGLSLFQPFIVHNFKHLPK